MKDFILITILTGALVTICTGIVYGHIAEQKEKEARAYQEGFRDGQAQKEDHLHELARKINVKIGEENT